MSNWHRRDGSKIEYKSIVAYVLTHPDGRVLNGKPWGWLGWVVAGYGMGFESQWVSWGWKVERVYG